MGEATKEIIFVKADSSSDGAAAILLTESAACDIMKALQFGVCACISYRRISGEGCPLALEDIQFVESAYERMAKAAVLFDAKEQQPKSKA